MSITNGGEKNADLQLRPDLRAGNAEKQGVFHHVGAQHVAVHPTRALRHHHVHGRSRHGSPHPLQLDRRTLRPSQNRPHPPVFYFQGSRSFYCFVLCQNVRSTMKTFTTLFFNSNILNAIREARNFFERDVQLVR